MLVPLLCFGIAIKAATGRPLHGQSLKQWQQSQQQQYWLDPGKPSQEQHKLVLPMNDSEPHKRIREIEQKQHGYLYGPSLLGNSSYFPTGPLGDAMVQHDQDQWFSDASWLVDTVTKEAASAAAALYRAGGLRNPSDYRFLYDGQWQGSVPSGLASGVLTNYTSDLLFSMERLSVNPYAIRRLHPTVEELPFAVDSAIAIKLSGTDLDTLHKHGRLFIVDHSYQAKYPTSKGKYTAACSAYFYIHPTSDDFLPLAIKSNVGANLVYTPLDGEQDWLLAKAMFNMNDLFHGQIFHLANSHAVTEIIHQAALRTLSGKHPIFVLLNRLMHQAYAIRPVGEKVLFNPGGYFDQSFAINSLGVRMFATEFYPTTAGAFQANYFENDLITRCILNCTYGPALKSIPFFEDAKIPHSFIRSFMTSFVEAYYTSENQLAQDNELQSWVREATESALVIDFPSSPLVYKSTLIDILTQVAFLNGVSHHVLNSGAPIATSGTLPLHPSAFYSPLPVKKGVKNIMPFLPPAKEALEHIALLARFNRPQLVAEKSTLSYMFSSAELLDRGCEAVRQAAGRFHQAMEGFSKEIQARRFGADGLSQGMPFLWRVLDPAQIPFFLSV